MKKFLLAAALLVLASAATFAQNVSGHCYRGYVDVGYTFGVPYNGDYAISGIEINTTHGYQISPYFFIGTGTGLHYKFSFENLINKRGPKVIAPIFADFRVNFMKTKVVPFIDLKAGALTNENWGYYINASIGCRYATTTKEAVNLLLGFLSEDLTFESIGTSSNRTSTNYIPAITLKIGYEF